MMTFQKRKNGAVRVIIMMIIIITFALNQWVYSIINTTIYCVEKKVSSKQIQTVLWETCMRKDITEINKNE